MKGVLWGLFILGAVWLLVGCAGPSPVQCEPGDLANSRCHDDQDRQTQGKGTSKPEPTKPDKPDPDPDPCKKDR